MSEYLGHLSSKNASVEWKIENFLDQEAYDGCIRSPKFLLSAADFYIEFYPNGATKDNVGWVSLYLCKDSPSLEIRVEYSIGLKNSADGSRFMSNNDNQLFTSAKEGWGFHKFMKSSQLIKARNFSGSDGTLTISCEARVVDVSESSASVPKGVVTKASPSPEKLSALETLSENFEKMYTSKWQTDVVMDVKGEKFSAHRSILSARSSVFRSMFELDMKEKKIGAINITDCDPESFGAFLLFVYSGKLDVVTKDNALGLYATAHKYDVQELKKECCQCLARELDIDSISDVLRLATFYKEQDLLNNATDHFINNASKILTTVKCQAFLRENLTMANKLYIKALNNRMQK